MKVRRWDWDQQHFLEDEYPDALFQPFLDWILTTRAWLEDPSLVNTKVLGLQRRLADYRSPPDTHVEADTLETAQSQEAVLAANIYARRVANLAKARAAKLAKREAAHAEG